MRKWYIINLLILIIFFILEIGITQESTYTDFKERKINSLSKDQIKGYLDGRGMGMALPAELNHYPGPKHVLELGDSLNISLEQKDQIQNIFDEMHEEAIILGESIVEKEKELDQLFASGKITDNSLASLISEISDLKGKLRFAHLNAHLKTRLVLNYVQIDKYDKLRGYGENNLLHYFQHGNHYNN
jgi:hypothetical protein